jgi:hypothetical protein
MSDVTVAVVPRETVSESAAQLRTMIELSPAGTPFVVVTAGYPDSVVAELKALVDGIGATLISRPTFLTPNQSRNLALAAVKTPYVVFVDNDVTVSENWLEPLVDCARTTGAALVSPMVFEFYPKFSRVHMAGGEARIPVGADGKRGFHELHYLPHQVADTSAMPRTETELVEFHTILVDAEWLRAQGGLDERISSFAEHWDLCILAAQSNRSVWIEPASRVNYSPPKNLTPEDIRFYEVRWSPEWFGMSIDRLIEKYELNPADPALKESWRWLRNHRSHRFTGLKKRLRPVLGKHLSDQVTKHWLMPLSDRFSSHRQEDLASWQQTAAGSH